MSEPSRATREPGRRSLLYMLAAFAALTVAVLAVSLIAVAWKAWTAE